MTEEQKRTSRRNKNEKILLVTVSVVIVMTIGISTVDVDGSKNNWKIISEEKSVVKKIGYIERSMFVNGETRIIGTYGNPLGNFDEVIPDPDWRFKEGMSFVSTETTTMPTCDTLTTPSLLEIVLRPIDKDYRECVNWITDRTFELK